VPKTEQVNIKLTPEDANAIDYWIKKGDFESRSEFIRFALRKVIKAYEGDRVGFEIGAGETDGAKKQTS